MKRIAITLALALLPITAIQPVTATKAEAGVWTCKKRSHTKKGRTWTTNKCSYSNKGSSR